jgi:hypothetical protein
LCGYKIISRCSGCNLDRSGRSGRNRNTRNRNRIGNCNRNLKPWFLSLFVVGRLFYGLCALWIFSCIVHFAYFVLLVQYRVF